MSEPLAGLPDEQLTLLDLTDRLLNRGVVLVGEATISVAGVDLIYLGLNVILTAVETVVQHERRLEKGRLEEDQLARRRAGGA